MDSLLLSLYIKCQNAIEVEDIETLKNILESEPNLIKFVDHFHSRETLLVFASKIGSAKACSFLIDQGADLNHKSKEDWTLLHYACDSKNIDVCKILIDRGADIHAKDTKGWTPLFHACSQGLEEICAMLISRGSNINEMSKFRETPLSIASKNRYNQICELLIENMTSVNVNEDYNLNKRKPLHWAVVNNRKDICELLVLKKGALVDVKDAYGFTPLYVACQCGYKDICEFLLDQGADLNLQDNTDLSYPLHAAALNNKETRYKDICEFLDNTDLSYSRHAAALNNKEITEMLIVRGAFRHVNAKNRKGDTPLHNSSSRGSFEKSKLLLEHGANVNEKNMHGYTPLHLAVLRVMFEDVCELLIEHGADVDAIDNFGYTPLFYAYQLYCKKVCELLERSRTASRRMDLLKFLVADDDF